MPNSVSTGSGANLRLDVVSSPTLTDRSGMHAQYRGRIAIRGSPIEHTKNLGSKGMNGDFALDLILDDQDHLNSGDGIYEVRLVDIKDRISSKSLVDVAGNVITPESYTIGIYPTPNTGSIKHISN